MHIYCKYICTFMFFLDYRLFPENKHNGIWLFKHFTALFWQQSNYCNCLQIATSCSRRQKNLKSGQNGLSFLTSLNRNEFLVNFIIFCNRILFTVQRPWKKAQFGGVGRSKDFKIVKCWKLTQLWKINLKFIDLIMYLYVVNLPY